MASDSLSRHELRKAIKTINSASERTILVQKLWQAEMYRECLTLFQFEGTDPSTIKSYLEVHSKIYLRQFLADGNQLKKLIPYVISYSNFLSNVEREALLSFISSLVEKQTSPQLKDFFKNSLKINEGLRQLDVTSSPSYLLAPQIAEHFDLHEEIYRRLLKNNGSSNSHQYLIYYKKGGYLVLAGQFGFNADLEAKLKENYSADISCMLQLLHKFSRHDYDFDNVFQVYGHDIINDLYFMDQIIQLMLNHLIDLVAKATNLTSKEITKFLTAFNNFLDILISSLKKVSSTLLEVNLIVKLWPLFIDLHRDEDVDLVKLEKLLNSKYHSTIEPSVDHVIHDFLIDLNIKIVEKALTNYYFEVLELVLLSDIFANKARDAYLAHLNQSLSGKFYCNECSKPHYPNLDSMDIDSHLAILSKAAKKKSLFDPASIKAIVTQLKAAKKELKK